MIGSKTMTAATKPWLGGRAQATSVTVRNPRRARAPRGRLTIGLGIAAVAVVLLAAPSRAAAQLVVEIVPAPPGAASALAGGTGTFDVDLVNTGSAAVSVGGWQVELSVPAGSFATFTAAVATGFSGGVTYIFGTEQLGPPLGTPLPSKDFTALDIDLTGPGAVSIAPGATVGLEHVTFSVAAGTASGSTVTVTDSGAGTLITDVNGGKIPNQTTQNGTIIVSPSTSVPEPSSLVLAGVAVAAAGLVARFRKPRS